MLGCQAEIPIRGWAFFSAAAMSLTVPGECRELKKGLYCPHSLIVADLDGDQRTDLVPGPCPGLRNRPFGQSHEKQARPE